MATESSFNEQLEEDVEIDELVAIIDNSLSSDEEPSDSDVSPNSGSAFVELKSKSVKESEANGGQRLLEDVLKLLIKQYKNIVNEKNAIIKEKNCFMVEKIQLIGEKNQVLEEKCRQLEEKESEMRNDNESLKQQLGEAMEQNKMLTEKRDYLKQRLDYVEKCFREELSVMKAQLDRQVELVKEKDREIKNHVIQRNKLSEEKDQLIEDMEDCNDELESQLEEATEENNKLTEENNKLTEERDQLKQKQIDDQKRFERELNVIKAQLDEQGKWLKEKDDQIEKRKQQTNEKLQQNIDLVNEKDSEIEKLKQQNETLQQKLSFIEQQFKSQSAEQINFNSMQLNNTTSIQCTPSTVSTATSTDSGSRQEPIVKENTSNNLPMFTLTINENRMRINNLMQNIQQRMRQREAADINQRKGEERLQCQPTVSGLASTATSSIDSESKQEPIVKENTLTGSATLNNDEIKAKSDENFKLLNDQMKILDQKMDLLKQSKASLMQAVNKSQQKEEQEQLQCQPTVSELPSTNDYPKEILLNRDAVDYLGFLITESLNGNGIHLSSVAPDSPAARAGLQTGERLLEVNGIDLRKANYFQAAEALRQCGLTNKIVVDAPSSSKKRGLFEITFADSPK